MSQAHDSRRSAPATGERAARGERVLTRRELNRALLARQLLLEPASGPLPRVLERIGGIQAQYAPSMYIGLWSRVEGFEREQLTRALERRSVAQGTLMRATIHLVSARDWWPLAAAIRGPRRDSWLRAHRDGPRRDEMEAAAAELRVRLADGPLRRREIDELLGKQRAAGVGIWLDLVRVPPSGTWERRRADLYAAAEAWLGAGSATPEEGLDQLVRRYLRGFGPARRQDVADFAGLPLGAVAPALDRLALRHFESEDGEALLDVQRAPLPDADTPAPVRFLPTWDATLLVHARRTGILPEEHRPKVFDTKTPHSVPTFLVDGAVAGSWRYDRGRISPSPFRSLARSNRVELEQEAERLAAFHA